MALKFYFYGTVTFSGSNQQQATGKRNAAGSRLDNRASRAGFVAEAWPDLNVWFPDVAPWPAGRLNVTIDGQPGLRFCYSTSSQTIADEAFNEVAAVWDVFQDSNSNWGTAAITVPD
jgi:hypothetical protein